LYVLHILVNVVGHLGISMHKKQFCINIVDSIYNSAVVKYGGTLFWTQLDNVHLILWRQQPLVLQLKIYGSRFDYFLNPWAHFV